MKQYVDLVQHVLDHGTRKANRTGTDTIGVFGYHYKHALKDGFPLLTTKEMQWHHIVLENLWFLSGDTRIDFLRHYKVKFWDPWADEEGKVPSAYGNYWVHFPVHRNAAVEGFNEVIPSFNNQIAFAVNTLRKDPLSRRVVISAWAPGNAQVSALPPCHVTWVLNTQYDKEGDLSLNLALLQRSCDIGLGVPYNLAGYSFLLHLFAQLTGLKVGEFSHTLVDAHIYVDHIDGLREQIRRETRALPTFRISNDIKEISDIEDIIASKPKLDEIMNIFQLTNYNPHPAIKYPVAV